MIGVLIQEALIVAVLEFVPGFVISIGLYVVASSSRFLPIDMTASRTGLVLTMTVVMCAASRGIAIGKLQSTDPADIF